MQRNLNVLKMRLDIMQFICLNEFYLGLEKRLQVAQSGLMPVAC